MMRSFFNVRRCKIAFRPLRNRARRRPLPRFSLCAERKTCLPKSPKLLRRRTRNARRPPTSTLPGIARKKNYRYIWYLYKFPCFCPAERSTRFSPREMFPLKRALACASCWGSWRKRRRPPEDPRTRSSASLSRDTYPKNFILQEK